jgi:hypothetical protein
MPAAFEKCVKNGGKVRTKKLGGGKYMHICYLNGKSYAGEVKTKLGGKKKGRKVVKKSGG